MAGIDQGLPACDREGWKTDTAGDFRTISLVCIKRGGTTIQPCQSLALPRGNFKFTVAKFLAASVTPGGWSTTNQQFQENDDHYFPMFSYDQSGVMQLSDSGVGVAWKLDTWGSDGLFCLNVNSGALTLYNNGPSSAANPIWSSTGGFVSGSGFPSSPNNPPPPPPQDPIPVTTDNNSGVDPGNGSSNPAASATTIISFTATNGGNPTTKGSPNTGSNSVGANRSISPSGSGQNMTLIASIAGAVLVAILIAIGIVVWVKKNKRQQQHGRETVSELGLTDVRDYSDDHVATSKVHEKDTKPEPTNASLGYATSIKLVATKSVRRNSMFKGAAFANMMDNSLAPANTVRGSWIIQPPQEQSGSSTYLSDLSEPAPAYRPRPPPVVVENVVTKVPAYYRAIHDYQAQYDQELSLVRNQHVYVTTLPDEDGWCKGQVEKKEGFVYAFDLAELE
ncbi:UNVERIFIED_CONTAM: hypothetical protein HDU68_003788 [Siphonaria sp. JEL0065]|nr:hypothetical protein HDU68_003788 [Siphonaria sp. JEL0065]